MIDFILATQNEMIVFFSIFNSGDRKMEIHYLKGKIAR